MAKKPHKKLTFWKRIRFKYKLSFLNENTLEEVFSIHISRLSAFLWIGLVVFLLITLTSIVIIKTPIRNYLPGYLDVEVRREMMNNALRADSLEQALAVQTVYLNNVGSILRGDMKIDSVREIDSLEKVTVTEFPKSKVSEEFIQHFEEEEKYNLGVTSMSSLPDNILFYRPVRGVVSSHFSLRDKHLAVDVSASLKESVLSTMNGTVIFTGFDANAGYVIQIQHKNGFVSIYKHNAMLLKNVGDNVNAGEAIALVGNTGLLSTGPHLHFELWYKGSPVDPEEFIVF